MSVFRNLEGQRFGKLLAARKSHKTNNNWHWECLCDCGNTSTPVGFSLTNGDVKSCGCIVKDNIAKLNLTHGEADKTPEYRAWSAMKGRCFNYNDYAYVNYGGRGITVCDRWVNSYESFLLDMGRRPTKFHSLDRFPNKNGNYEPSNCRWATPKQQADNRRSNVLIEYNNEILTQNEWAKRLNISYHSIAWRLKRNVPFHEIFLLFSKE